VTSYETLIREDAHVGDMALLLDRIRGVAPRGVIHVGAHEGEEVAEYLRRGYRAIALIEANPEKFEFLKRQFGARPGIHLSHCAIADREGALDFHVHTSRSGSVEPASLLPLKEFGRIVATLKTERTIKVPASTLDRWLARGKLDVSHYNLLVTDIQGADYLALLGARKLLPHMQAVITEVSLIEMYEGCRLVQDTVVLMGRFGFRPELLIAHELQDAAARFPAWGEMLFLRS